VARFIQFGSVPHTQTLGRHRDHWRVEEQGRPRLGLILVWRHLQPAGGDEQITYPLFIRRLDDMNTPDLDDKIFNDALKRELAPVLATLLRAGVVSQGSSRARATPPDPRPCDISDKRSQLVRRKLLDDLAA
jgi:hypothetical protein